MSTSLLLGGTVESGASQVWQYMGGSRTAYMTSTLPKAVFYGQLIGSFTSAWVATLIYRLYTTVKQIPSADFGSPDAHLWLVAATLAKQRSLPPMARESLTRAFKVGPMLSLPGSWDVCNNRRTSFPPSGARQPAMSLLSQTVWGQLSYAFRLCNRVCSGARTVQYCRQRA